MVSLSLKEVKTCILSVCRLPIPENFYLGSVFCFVLVFFHFHLEPNFRHCAKIKILSRKC